MIRPQRRMHAWLWPLIAVALAVGIAAGLAARRGSFVQPAAATSGANP
ncbi:MAG: hypothetical protein ACKVS8_07470 [Phycisphaerales bacterium]